MLLCVHEVSWCMWVGILLSSLLTYTTMVLPCTNNAQCITQYTLLQPPLADLQVSVAGWQDWAAQDSKTRASLGGGSNSGGGSGGSGASGVKGSRQSARKAVKADTEGECVHCIVLVLGFTCIVMY